ncbi:MAG: Sb-PDE family phosphodiesterase [Pseudomonadales bacterium]
MSTSIRLLCSILALAASVSSSAHGPARAGPSPERHIQFPDTQNYQTLVLDLHTHSVFSDGHVWPTVRVSEALRDGLDGLAITEHLEFQPHLSDIPHPDRNRAYEEALRAADGHPLAVIPGVEITRVGPPGHINAVFIKDANPLVKQRSENEPLPSVQFDTREEAEEYSIRSGEIFRGAHAAEEDGKTIWRPYPSPGTYEAVMNYGLASSIDPRKVLEAANEQGAFVFWNHPSFDKVDAGLNKFHKAAAKSGLLHGVEIANGDHYYENAHRLALKHNLALIGVSDVHELIEWDYRPEAEHNPGHRPVTLVLANGKSMDAMREALFERRSIVWWKDMLIGREAHLNELLAASLSIESVEKGQWGLTVKIRNASDAPFKLRQRSKQKLSKHASILEVAPNAITDVSINVNNQDAAISLEFDVLNALVAPNKAAKITLSNR